MSTTMLDDESSKKVFRQVEFYFSDSNLPKDEFLKNSISENEDGMVNLSLICSFSKMKSHLSLGALKADEIPDEIIKAVAETLKTSQLLKISDDGKKVGRKTELAKVEELIEQQDSRTIAVSPLPYDVTREDVESFFAQHAKVNCVRLPSHVSNRKLFCGTALVEFSSDEDMEKMLKQNLAYAGVDLELKPKKEFDVEREKQTAEIGDVQATSCNKSPEEASYPKGLIVAFSIKSNPSKDDSTKSADPVKLEIASEDKKDDPSVEDNKENANDTTNSVADEKGDEDEKKSLEESNEEDEKKGPSEERFNYNDCKDNMNVVLREDLKAVFGKFGTVKYVDFKAGDTSGYIRFEEAEAAQKARAAAVLSAEEGLVVKNFIATLEPVRLKRNIGTKSALARRDSETIGETEEEEEEGTTDVGKAGGQEIMNQLGVRIKFGSEGDFSLSLYRTSTDIGLNNKMT
ncbi:hypothetical protein V2J09_005264 [Rumex salicifolius]